MSDSTLPPPPPPGAAGPPPVEPESPRRRFTRAQLLVVLAAVVLLAVVIGVAASNSSDDDSTSSAATSSESESDDDSPAPPRTRDVPSTTTTVAQPPGPEDFTVTLTTERSACFGSAGCNITVVPDIAWAKPEPYSYDETVRITYQIDGSEYGPVIETIDLDPSGSYDLRSSTVSTPSAETVLTAYVTSVRDVTLG